MELNSPRISCTCPSVCCISSVKDSKRSLKQHGKIALHNTLTAAISWEGTYWALSPLGSLLAQRVTISGWRSRLEWHGCSWGMRGIPLVNTSCSDGHRTLISPVPIAPFNHHNGWLVIKRPLFFFFDLLFLWPLLGHGRWGCYCWRPLFTWGTTWFIIHSDAPTPPMGKQSQLWYYCIKYNGFQMSTTWKSLSARLAQAPSGPGGALFSW